MPKALVADEPGSGDAEMVMLALSCPARLLSTNWPLAETRALMFTSGVALMALASARIVVAPVVFSATPVLSAG